MVTNTVTRRTGIESNAVILEKLDNLEALMKRLETKQDSLDCRVQEIERNMVRSDSVHVTIDDHEKRLRELEQLAPAMRAVIWLAATLGVSVIALVWALITGTASVIFR